jgi:hypothetical protein
MMKREPDIPGYICNRMAAPGNGADMSPSDNTFKQTRRRFIDSLPTTKPLAAMKKPLIPLFVLAALSTLAGCATQEYQAAQNQCRPQAYRQYPVANQQRWETRSREVEVPTGKSKCVTRNTGNNQTETICEDIKEKRYQNYQALVTVDVNTDPRDAMVKACAQDICMRQFGNPGCETGR